jgi:hypothetical protein
LSIAERALLLLLLLLEDVGSRGADTTSALLWADAACGCGTLPATFIQLPLLLFSPLLSLPTLSPSRRLHIFCSYDGLY